MREFHCGENKTCQNGLQKTSYGQETLDKAFLILYICRSNYQWIKEKLKIMKNKIVQYYNNIIVVSCSS